MSVAHAPLLTTAAELTDLVTAIRAAGRLAIDTEFVWERTYRPELGVVQIATDGVVAVIDAVALKDLSPLFPVLQDPAIPVVLHGGGQDLEIMAVLMGAPMRNVIDTQVEAAFLGYGLQVGLSVLLERVLKVRIRKDQTYTDWLRRPLKPEQVVYAEQDVVHLLGEGVDVLPVEGRHEGAVDPTNDLVGGLVGLVLRGAHPGREIVPVTASGDKVRQRRRLSVR